MKRFASIIETVPVPCRIFGTALRPFCLGHHLLFTRLGLPFADNPAADSTTEQLMQAIAICAGESYEKTLAALLDGTWVKVYENWLKKIRKLPPEKNAVATFRNHLEAGYRSAPVWVHVSKSEIKLSSPWETLLKCKLVGSGFSISDVMNGYLPDRWYDYYTTIEIRQSETAAEKDWKKIFFTLADALDFAESEPTPEEAP